MSQTSETLSVQLADLGVTDGDGLFVHASMSAVGPIEGAAATLVEALLTAVGTTGLLGMPGFTDDAVLTGEPPVDRVERAQREAKVPGYDPARSPTHGMGVVAETFRKWPGTLRSAHPVLSVCLRGPRAMQYLAPHRLDWATGADTPLGHLRDHPGMKMLLIGVGWNRCSALHTAESLAATRRTKIRRFLSDGVWIETPDVANDNDRLFPLVGSAFEKTGAVTRGVLGDADCCICGYADLVSFAKDWIDRANRASGDRH